MKFKLLIWLVIAMSLLVVFILDEVTKEDVKEESIYDTIYNLENNLYSYEVQASIDHEKIYITDESSSYEVDLPDNLFYIAFAPYINLTHACYTHSLTGCQGEMINKDIDVRIYDESNNLIEEKTYNTGDDGFIGLYLDKIENYQILVQHNGLVSSFTSNPYQTCYTEVKLS